MAQICLLFLFISTFVLFSRHVSFLEFIFLILKNMSQTMIFLFSLRGLHLFRILPLICGLPLARNLGSLQGCSLGQGRPGCSQQTCIWCKLPCLSLCLHFSIHTNGGFWKPKRETVISALSQNSFESWHEWICSLKRVKGTFLLRIRSSFHFPYQLLRAGLFESCLYL